MLDPERAGAIWQKHFDTVTPEAFVARVKRVSPDLAQEWLAIAPSRRSAPSVSAPSRGRAVFSHPSAGPS